MNESVSSPEPTVCYIGAQRRLTEPCSIVIFGASGDLTARKLLPALYRLMYERRLSPGFAVVGVSRTPMSDDQFREKMRESVEHFLEDSPFETDLWTSFAKNLFYIAGDPVELGLVTSLSRPGSNITGVRRCHSLA